MRCLIVFIILAGLPNMCEGQEMTKPRDVREMLDGIQEIQRLAESSGSVDRPRVRQYLEQVVTKMGQVDRLATFAIISRNIAWPQNAGDEVFDQWFDEAFWLSIEIIAKTEDHNGAAVLQQISQRICLHGGDKLRFEALTQQATR
jgi:hypothetical protein